MRVTISSSSNDAIDEKYRISARRITDYLADKGCELNWGSGSSSIMGVCYDSFSDSNCQIHGYTTRKYQDDINNLPNAEHTVYDDTFDLKKNIFNDADLIICFAGGTGTISEFFAYLEEIRSNDNPKKLVIYDENNHFTSTLNLIDDLVKRKFNSSSIYDYFKVIKSYKEFVEYFENIDKR